MILSPEMASRVQKAKAYQRSLLHEKKKHLIQLSEQAKVQGVVNSILGFQKLSQTKAIADYTPAKTSTPVSHVPVGQDDDACDHEGTSE